MTTADQKLNQEVIKNPNEVEYTLESPIHVGGQIIEKIKITKPGVIALSGVALQDIMRSDVNALCAVIPKCTYPQIPSQAMTLLDPTDLLQIGGYIIYFLMPKSQRPDIQL